MKTVLVTGASAGFGQAIAEKFLSEGHRVIACARRLDKLKALADRFPDLALPLQLDVTDKEAVKAMPAKLPAAFANVDVVVNNAGLALGLSPAHQTDIDDWDRMIETNCSGLVHVTRALLPQMHRASRAWARRRRAAIAQRDLRSLDGHALRDIGLSHRAAAEGSRGPRDDALDGPGEPPCVEGKPDLRIRSFS